MEADFKGIYQVRHEAIEYHDPIITLINNWPLEYDFQGVAIGVIKYQDASTGYYDALKSEVTITNAHYYNSGTGWIARSTTQIYNLTNFSYIWFASFISNNFKITGDSYA
jgi:hypothetical protein